MDHKTSPERVVEASSIPEQKVQMIKASIKANRVRPAFIFLLGHIKVAEKTFSPVQRKKRKVMKAKSYMISRPGE